jgi:NADP-dependent 3-hydroxy acid dehydrogenase YdfG
MRSPADAPPDLTALPNILITRPNILITRLDIEDPASITAAISLTLQKFPTLDVLLNNAGFALGGIFESLSPEKIRQQFNTNVLGLMDVTRAVLPIMRKQKSGTIINVSSRAGIIGQPLISLYSASKFALEGFSEALAFELAS